MDWLLYLVFLAIFGLIVGAFARLALPGKDPLSLFQTMLLGLAGSFIAASSPTSSPAGATTAPAGSSRSSAPPGSCTSSAAGGEAG
jgi:uncharacterized membrane protein YeaQ/YmgE (transglycosylase-associated protein family)